MGLRHALWAFCWILLLNSCTKREDVVVQRLDQTLFAGKSREAVRAFLNNNRTFAETYFGTNQFGEDSALVAGLHQRINDPELNVLHGQVQQTFGDLTDLRHGLAEAFTNIRRDYPDFRSPKIVTVMTGFGGPDLVVTDSLIVIGLDWFAGPTAKYRPQGPEFPQYVLRRYQPNYILPGIVFALSNKYNLRDAADKTLLADMVYYGKGYVFTKAMLPEVADSLILNYTDRQLTETYNAQDLVWAHFIDNQLLYVTNPDIKRRYLAERPFTAEIGPRCPGAIGRWLGWRIVGRYVDERNVAIPALMKNTNARQIFEQSGYKGQIENEE